MVDALPNVLKSIVVDPATYRYPHLRDFVIANFKHFANPRLYRLPIGEQLVESIVDIIIAGYTSALQLEGMIEDTDIASAIFTFTYDMGDDDAWFYDRVVGPMILALRDDKFDISRIEYYNAL